MILIYWDATLYLLLETKEFLKSELLANQDGKKQEKVDLRYLRSDCQTVRQGGFLESYHQRLLLWLSITTSSTLSCFGHVRPFTPNGRVIPIILHAFGLWNILGIHFKSCRIIQSLLGKTQKSSLVLLISISSQTFQNAVFMTISIGHIHNQGIR